MVLEAYLTPTTLAITAILVATASLLGTILNNLLFSPLLASIPGPLLARISGVLITLVDLSGLHAQVLHRLHQKHGPIIRIGPNEHSFSNPDATKAIYVPGTTCIKSSVYSAFGRQGMFQMQDPDQHQHRQRRVSHIFSTSSTIHVEPLVQRVINNLIQEGIRDSGHVALFRIMALDVSGEVLMEKSFSSLDAGDTKEKREGALYIKQLDATYTFVVFQVFCPPLARLMGLLPVERLQVLANPWKVVYQYGKEALRDYIDHNGRTGEEVVGNVGMKTRRTLLSKLVEGNKDLGTEPLPDEEISEEIRTSYALYRLAYDKRWQERLREEIRQCQIKAGKFSGEALSFSALQNLTILHGVVMETLSLYSSAYTLHRDPRIYGDNPELFIPDCWSSGGVSSMQRMQGSLFAFGALRKDQEPVPGNT
ncbi:cytochrome P450 [Triangularia setosa]|uniref:Cytochrome P450 n=1 Tax=Triangularia setosa TaxID=2587417 RepID=A0AAN7A4I6_9PEZI|nr:cytochrome P450 [Podospora setosa]